MAQVFGILGFFLGLLALFFASEVSRRANHRQAELEAALFKAMTRLQKIESNVFHVEKLAADLRYQRKRQAETLTALAKKGEAQAQASSNHARGSGERFTPSTHHRDGKRKTG